MGNPAYTDAIASKKVWQWRRFSTPITFYFNLTHPDPVLNQTYKWNQKTKYQSMGLTLLNASLVYTCINVYVWHTRDHWKTGRVCLYWQRLLYGVRSMNLGPLLREFLEFVVGTFFATSKIDLIVHMTKCIEYKKFECRAVVKNHLSVSWVDISIFRYLTKRIKDTGCLMKMKRMLLHLQLSVMT